MELEASGQNIILEVEDYSGQLVVVRERTYVTHTAKELYKDADVRAETFNYVASVLREPRLVTYDKDDPNSTRRHYVDLIAAPEIFERVKVLTVIVETGKTPWEVVSWIPKEDTKDLKISRGGVIYDSKAKR